MCVRCNTNHRVVKIFSKIGFTSIERSQNLVFRSSRSYIRQKRENLKTSIFEIPKETMVNMSFRDSFKLFSIQKSSQKVLKMGFPEKFRSYISYRYALISRTPLYWNLPFIQHIAPLTVNLLFIILLICLARIGLRFNFSILAVLGTRTTVVTCL